MAESHVVSALVSKRAEIAGLIARTEQQLGQFRADLVHLDATLRLFAPGLELKTIPAKRIRQADLWFLAYPVCCQYDKSVIICRSGLPRLSNNASRFSAGFSR